MKWLLFILFLGLQAGLIFYYQKLGNSQEGRTSESPGQILLKQAQNLEGKFDSYLGKVKGKILEDFEDKSVQKLSRSKVRKKFSFDSKSQSMESAVRINVYTVNTRAKDNKFRSVYEDHKPPLIWDKILNALVGQALEASGEAEGGSSGEKFLQMLSMVMKKSGISEIKKPGKFTTLDMFGEDLILYWNTIYKRCPSRIRKEKGIKQCVKGIFLAEIDRRNLVRDFYQSLPDEDLPEAMIMNTWSEGVEFAETIFPFEAGQNTELSRAYFDSRASGLPTFYQTKTGTLGLVVNAGHIPHTSLAIVDKPDRPN